jgi:hypothetical protein
MKTSDKRIHAKRPDADDASAQRVAVRGEGGMSKGAAAYAHRQLQGVADGSTGVKQLVQLQALADGRPSLQRAAASPASATGLPPQLKEGIESMSGLDMSDVRVHRNSSKPAQLQAHAYAQGSDIHLGPGQERHLPHEAWHVVQQRQGRVKETASIGGIGINDEPALEAEADVRGAQAWSRGAYRGNAADRPTQDAVQLRPTLIGGGATPSQMKLKIRGLLWDTTIDQPWTKSPEISALLEKLIDDDEIHLYESKDAAEKDCKKVNDLILKSRSLQSDHRDESKPKDLHEVIAAHEGFGLALANALTLSLPNVFLVLISKLIAKNNVTLAKDRRVRAMLATSVRGPAHPEAKKVFIRAYGLLDDAARVAHDADLHMDILVKNVTAERAVSFDTSLRQSRKHLADAENDVEILRSKSENPERDDQASLIELVKVLDSRLAASKRNLESLTEEYSDLDRTNILGNTEFKKSNPEGFETYQIAEEALRKAGQVVNKLTIKLHDIVLTKGHVRRGMLGDYRKIRSGFKPMMDSAGKAFMKAKKKMYPEDSVFHPSQKHKLDELDEQLSTLAARAGELMRIERGKELLGDEDSLIDVSGISAKLANQGKMANRAYLASKTEGRDDERTIDKRLRDAENRGRSKTLGEKLDSAIENMIAKKASGGLITSQMLVGMDAGLMEKYIRKEVAAELEKIRGEPEYAYKASYAEVRAELHAKERKEEGADAVVKWLGKKAKTFTGKLGSILGADKAIDELVEDAKMAKTVPPPPEINAGALD